MFLWHRFQSRKSNLSYFVVLAPERKKHCANIVMRKNWFAKFYHFIRLFFLSTRDKNFLERGIIKFSEGWQRIIEQNDQLINKIFLSFKNSFFIYKKKKKKKKMQLTSLITFEKLINYHIAGEKESKKSR